MHENDRVTRDGDFVRWTDDAGIEREAVVYDDEAGNLAVDTDYTSPENVAAFGDVMTDDQRRTAQKGA